MDSDDQDIFSEFRDPERKRLIKQIPQETPQLSEIPLECYLSLWLSDKSRLGELATSSDKVSVQALLEQQLRIDHIGIIAGPRWGVSSLPSGSLPPGKRKRDSSTLSTEDPTVLEDKRDPRDPNITSIVLNRDNDKCVLTGNPRWTGSHVCHIIPHKINSQRGDKTWSWLRVFWGAEQTEKWQKAILGKNGKIDTEQVINMLTLSAQTHSYWANSVCAFRPISVTSSDDKKIMTLAFHWCPPRNESLSPGQAVSIEENLYEEYPNGFIDSPVPGVGLLDPLTKMNMKSGRIFTIETADPENKPLPSFELLDLLWKLTRIRAMRGAADDSDSDEDEDQEDSFSFRSRSPSRSPSPADIHPVLQDYLDSYNPGRSITPKCSKTPSITSGPEDGDFVKVG